MSTLHFAFQYQKNAAIKVFSKLFVGISPIRGDDKIPLAFATPYEENAAGRKRQQTVQNWLDGKRTPKIKDGRYVYDENHQLQYEPDMSTTRTIENVPREGFRVTDDVKRVYWGGGNVVWRVADPDGWEVEIQSSNLMALIQCSGIAEGGLIPGKCVWGRADGINVLLHETSEEYKDSIKAAETLKAPKQVAKSSREVGGVYRLVDGTIAVYLGKVHVTRVRYDDGGNIEGGNTELTFPPIADMSPNATLTALGNWSVYNLEPSEPFEAVVHVKEDGTLAKALLLYKKVPLVDYIQAHPLPEVTNALLDSFDWKFASSSITCMRISSVTVEPITDPVVRLLPWTDKQYADTAAKLAKSNFNYYGMWVDQWFKTGEHAIMLDDTLCGNIGLAGNRDKGLPYAQPLIIGEGCYTVLTATDDGGNVYGHGGYRSSRYWNRATRPMYPHPERVKVIPIHGVKTFEDYQAWFQRLADQRALFTIVVRNEK